MGAATDAHGWLALLLTPKLGIGQLKSLGLEPGEFAGLAARNRSSLKQLGLPEPMIRAIQAPNPERLDACLRWLDHPDHHLVSIEDPLYPPLLKTTVDPPLVLLVHGSIDVLVRPQIAIIGSRNATPGGLTHAAEFARQLSKAGFVITSGLALGIDGQAHRAAIQSGGLTVAVAGTGPDQVYPARHRDLAHDIVSNGAMISSFAPGVGPRPGHFPARNRIISGMSLGVLVIEAGLKSGSLITARLAGEQGREVFAVPGSINNPQARGCHQLIRQGATLVEGADDMIEDLQAMATELADTLRTLLPNQGASDPSVNDIESTQSSPDVPQNADMQRLLECVGYDPVPVESIIERSAMDTQSVLAALLQLELEGLVTAHAGGRYSRG